MRSATSFLGVDQYHRGRRLCDRSLIGERDGSLDGLEDLLRRPDAWVQAGEADDGLDQSQSVRSLLSISSFFTPLFLSMVPFSRHQARCTGEHVCARSSAGDGVFVRCLTAIAPAMYVRIPPHAQLRCSAALPTELTDRAGCMCSASLPFPFSCVLSMQRSGREAGWVSCCSAE
jgi:hypothetical protein